MTISSLAAARRGCGAEIMALEWTDVTSAEETVRVVGVEGHVTVPKVAAADVSLTKRWPRHAGIAACGTRVVCGIGGSFQAEVFKG